MAKGAQLRLGPAEQRRAAADVSGALHVEPGLCGGARAGRRHALCRGRPRRPPGPPGTPSRCGAGDRGAVRRTPRRAGCLGAGSRTGPARRTAAVRAMRMKDPVPAVAEVVSCHALPPGRGSARWFNAVLELDVLMPGVAPYRVQRRCNAPSRNWPQPGGRLPVTVDRSDPARLSVRWREVLTPNEAAAATRLAA